MIPDRIAHRVANGELDVGLSMGLAKLSPQLEQVPLGSSPSLLVCSRGHPLFARARVSAKSLLEHRSVIPEFLGQEHLPVLDQFPDRRGTNHHEAAASR
jgi:DNA-binding transcriptional LysR family regulator